MRIKPMSTAAARRLFDFLLKEGYSEQQAHEILNFVAFGIKPNGAK